ncbi:GATA zinc finger domain-containing protein 14-like [Stomoxys calcitrans]|uniref:GATA zinc finger domain-containing protein 14-like n=1 Tax=Stomoxys calcitrans TaxID=35570 RepID=UPI0027E28E7D|nr:GATA zinc finger domain-containing protein 14-like [Stomoxys calcitrans]
MGRTKLTTLIDDHLRKSKMSMRDKYVVDTVSQTRKYLKENEDLLILTADKGGKTVALYKDDYEQKMKAIIHDMCMYRRLKIDPTSRLQTRNNKLVDKLHNLNLISIQEKNKLTSKTALAPRIYGLPKIHKEGTPLRPICSSINAPSYHLLTFETTTVDFYNEIKHRLRRLNSKALLVIGEGEAANQVSLNNMKSALHIFKNKMPEPMRTVLTCRNPDSLESAMDILFESGYAYMGKDGRIVKRNDKGKRQNNEGKDGNRESSGSVRSHNNRNNYNNNRSNEHNNHNYNNRSNDYNNHNHNNNNNNRSNEYNNHNYQHRENHNYRQDNPNYNYNRNQQRHGQNHNQSQQPEPMEINNVQPTSSTENHQNYNQNNQLYNQSEQYCKCNRQNSNQPRQQEQNEKNANDAQNFQPTASAETYHI